MFLLSRLLHGKADLEFERAEPILLGDAPQCSVCGEFVGMLEWLPPRRARIRAYGPDEADIAFVAADEFLVSHEFVDEFAKLQLSGVKAFDLVEVIGRSFGKEWYYPDLLDGTGSLHPSARMTTDATRCESCLSLRADLSAGFTVVWDGEPMDMSRVRGLPGAIVVSGRFAHLSENLRLGNLIYTPTEDFVRVEPDYTARPIVE